MESESNATDTGLKATSSEANPRSRRPITMDVAKAQAGVPSDNDPNARGPQFENENQKDNKTFVKMNKQIVKENLYKSIKMRCSNLKNQSNPN